jgi:hypothetical protein
MVFWWDGGRNRESNWLEREPVHVAQGKNSVGVISRETLLHSLSFYFPCFSMMLPLGDNGWNGVRVKVTLRLTISQSVCLGVEPTLWTFDQILLPFKVFGSEICCLVSVGRPLRREAGSVLCKSQSSHLSVCTFTIYIFVFHTFTTYIYIYYTIH